MIPKPYKEKLLKLDFGLSNEIGKEVNKTNEKIKQEKEIDSIAAKYEILRKKYHDSFINIKGKILFIKFIELQSIPITYEYTIEIEEDSKMISTITISRMKEEMHQNMQLIKDGTYIYLTSLSSKLILTENINTIKNEYITTVYTQFFYEEPRKYMPKILISKVINYETTMTYITTKKGTKRRIIETLSQKQLISILDTKQCDFKALLSYQVPQNIFKIELNYVEKIFNKNENNKIESVIGRIHSINQFVNRKGKSQLCMRLSSLINNNSIDIYFGQENQLKDIDINSIVQLRNLYRRINEKIKIFLYIAKSSTFQILGHASLIELPIMKFNYSTTLKQLTPLIYLQNKQLIRYNMEFIGKIVQVYSIRGHSCRKSMQLPFVISFQTIALIDDGTSIAMCYISTSSLAPLINLSKKKLDDITKVLYQKYDLLLYGKDNLGNYIHYKEISPIFEKEFYCIGIPFCNMHQIRRLNYCNIETYIQQKWSSDISKQDKIIANYCYVNGKICNDYQFKERGVALQSCLNIIHIENLSEEI